MNVKVIATSFSPRRQVRTHYERKLNYPDHYQNIESEADCLNQIRGVVEFELKNDPGEEMDIVIVNSEHDYPEGKEYLDGLNNLKTRWGKIRVLHRKPIGWSFGAYNHAFQTFKNEYDYWLFTEDDILIGGKKYYTKIKEKLGDNGFVSLVKVCEHPLGKHAGGGVGLTSRDVLLEVERVHGELPHHTKIDHPQTEVTYNRDFIIQNGEVPFTNIIHNLGYELIDYGNATEWNLDKNLCLPYYNYIYGI